ncbi:MAG TPA: hypothetical protein VHC69_11895 [Polyangiaceae bacterium]|nr:hypothetical protein [Polyangiaceae bacterium]
MRVYGAVIFALAALPSYGCTLDHRYLEASASDAALVVADGQARPLTYIKDAGQVHYSLDAGGGPPDASFTPDLPPPTNTGCMHFVNGDADCADTVALNADFNTDIKGWTSDNQAVLRWVNFDSQNASGSGSLGVKVATIGDFDGPVEAAASQCITVDSTLTYQYQASVYIKRGQIDGGQAQIEVWFFDQDGCQGLVHTPSYTIGTFYTTDKWADLVAQTNLKPPDGVKSMSVRLGVQKPFRSDPFEALFDAIRVTTYK